MLKFRTAAPFLCIFAAASSQASAFQSNIPFDGRWYDALAPLRGAVGDYNSDGRSDVVAGANSNIQLRVYPGDGLGSLGAPIVTNYNSLALLDLQSADLNNDGVPDLVFTYSQLDAFTFPPHTIDHTEIKLGNGAGGFLASQNISFPFSTGVWRAAVGDVNGDGKPDIVYSSQGLTGSANPTTVPVLLNLGSGAFGASIFIDIGTPSIDVLLADLNNDGSPDLIAAPKDQTTVPGTALRVSMNSGGNLTFPGAFEMGGIVNRAAVADFDGDGKQDLAAFLQLSGSMGLSTRVGNGAANFNQALVTNIPVSGIFDFTIADFNEDGARDFAISTTAVDDNITIWTGGLFALPTLTTKIGTGNSANVLRPIDLNQDGHRDIVALHIQGNSLSTWIASGPNAFYSTSGVASGGAPNAIKSGDFNGDGDADFIAIELPYTAVSVMLSQSSGSGAPAGWNPSVNYNLNGQAFSFFIAKGDIDLDGDLDIATINSFPFEFDWLTNNGDGTFAAVQWMPTPNMYPADFELSDMNGDGLADIVISQAQVPEATANYYQIAVYLANGLGGFLANPGFVKVLGKGDLTIGDTNADGKRDVVVRAGTKITNCAGNGAGGFGAVRNSNVSTNLSFVELAECNGNGVVDLVTWGYGVQCYAGTGGGFFTPIGNIAGSPTIFFSLGVAFEANGDGAPDFAGLDYSKDRIQLFFGDGAGNMSAPIYIATVHSPNSLGLCDVNKDGRPDLAVGTGGGGSGNWIHLHLNSGTLGGILHFGAGVAGCNGMHQFGVNSLPEVGNSNFAFTCTNAPPSSIGLLLAGSLPDPSGFDIFGLGVPNYINVASPELFGLDFYSYNSTFAVSPAPIPNNPLLSGMQYSAQGYWLWTACAPSPLGVSVTDGMTITIQ